MLIKLFLVSLSVSLFAVSYGIPRQNNNYEEENSETETILPITTESPYEGSQTESTFEETQTESNSEWHGVWEKAKSLIDRVRGHTGSGSDSSVRSV